MMLSIKPGDKYYQVLLERMIENYDAGVHYDTYKDGEVYIDADVYVFEIDRARALSFPLTRVWTDRKKCGSTDE
jgi:hypothetical protein